jgi:glycosyltransferase involved in cell wall biosynthesis
MRVAFAIENQLGHRALLSNLKAALEHERDVEPLWFPVDPKGEGLLALPRVRDKHALIFGLKLRKVMRQAEAQANGRLDACFVHTQRMAHLAVDRMKKLPTFISIDATPAELDEIYRGVSGLASERGNFYWNIRDAIHRRTYRAARGMIAMSSAIARTLSTVYRVDPANVLVLLPGVDTELWRPPPARAPGDEIRLLFIGADFERKGGQLLLRWARETARKDFTLDIVTEQAIEPTPRVTVHGKFKPGEPGLVELVQRADLLVHPTRGDMSAWVISEAKAAGTAVLSTRMGGIPELVREGVDGYIVPPDDYTSFAERLEAMLADRQVLADFGLRAREDAVERLDARKNAHRLLEFMRARLH